MYRFQASLILEENLRTVPSVPSNEEGSKNVAWVVGHGRSLNGVTTDKRKQTTK